MRRKKLEKGNNGNGMNIGRKIPINIDPKITSSGENSR
jgi:hypothetical protein